MDLGHYLVVEDVRREVLATLEVLREAGAADQREVVDAPVMPRIVTAYTHPDISLN